MKYKFDWDVFKEISNQEKHNVSFQEAMEVFADPLAMSIYDEDHSFNEDRWITIGMSLDTELLLVIHTWVEHHEDQVLIRIISARPATKRETQQYQEEPSL